MLINRITLDNIEEYEILLDADAVKNIERKYYCGLAVKEDNGEKTEAAIIWEYKHMDDEKDIEARIYDIYAINKKSAKILMEAYTEEIKKNDVKKSFLEHVADDELIRDVLKASGFVTEEKENRNLTVTLKELAVNPVAKKEAPQYIAPITDLMVRQYQKGIKKCIQYGRKGLLEDLEFLPMSWFDEDISCCVQIDGKVNGFLLVNKSSDGYLVVDLLYACEPDSGINLLYMISYSINAALKLYPDDTKVLLRRHNDVTKSILKKLFPGKKGDTILIAERIEKEN